MYCVNLHPFISESIQSSNSRSHVRRWRWPLFDFLITCWVLSKWTLQKATGLWNLSVFRRWLVFNHSTFWFSITVLFINGQATSELARWHSWSLPLGSKHLASLAKLERKSMTLWMMKTLKRCLFMYTYIHSFEKKKVKKGEFNFFSAISEVGEWNDLLLKSHLFFSITI